MSVIGNKRIWSFVLCGLCVATSYASVTFKDIFYNDNWFLGASIGAAWPSLENHTTVANGSPQPKPYDYDYYTVKHSSATKDWSFYLGYRWLRDQAKWIPQYRVALRYQSLSTFRVSGTIEQYSLPDFVNYTYHANVYSNALTLFGKLDIYDFHSFEPYVSFGFGQANNQFSTYAEKPYPDIIARDNPAFHNRRSTNFTYDVGAGLDYIINKKVSVSLGYEYTNLGGIRSSAGTGPNWYGTALSLGNLSSNALLFTVFYQLPLG